MTKMGTLLIVIAMALGAPAALLAGDGQDEKIGLAPADSEAVASGSGIAGPAMNTRPDIAPLCSQRIVSAPGPVRSHTNLCSWLVMRTLPRWCSSAAWKNAALNCIKPERSAVSCTCTSGRRRFRRD